MMEQFMSTVAQLKASGPIFYYVTWGVGVILIFLSFVGIAKSESVPGKILSWGFLFAVLYMLIKFSFTGYFL